MWSSVFDIIYFSFLKVISVRLATRMITRSCLFVLCKICSKIGIVLTFGYRDRTGTGSTHFSYVLLPYQKALGKSSPRIFHVMYKNSKVFKKLVKDSIRKKHLAHRRTSYRSTYFCRRINSGSTSWRNAPAAGLAALASPSFSPLLSTLLLEDGPYTLAMDTLVAEYSEVFPRSTPSM